MSLREIFISPDVLNSMLILFIFVRLSYFIHAVQMLKCLGSHSCRSSTFLIAILNVFAFSLYESNEYFKTVLLN